MSANEEDQRGAFFVGAGFVTIFLAGLVLASSYFVSYPAALLSGAWLIALLATAAVLVLAFRQARAAGTGFFTAIGQSLKALGRFVFAFF